MDEKKAVLKQMGWSNELIEHFFLPTPWEKNYPSISDPIVVQSMSCENMTLSFHEPLIHSNIKLTGFGG